MIPLPTFPTGPTTLEDLIALKVTAAVHAALDEREANKLPPVYTLSQVEVYYDGGVKASTLRALCRAGRLPYVRFSPEGPYYLTPEGLKQALKILTRPAKPFIDIPKTKATPKPPKPNRVA